MWEMGKNSILLFFSGKLFADPKQVHRQMAIAIAVTTVLLIVAAKLGLPLWASAILAGLVGGALQPYLFKDLRYR
jgi:hypothetical protein